MAITVLPRLGYSTVVVAAEPRSVLARVPQFLLAMLVVIGVYCPTSLEAERSKVLLFVPLAVAALVFALWIVASGISRIPALCAMASLAILIVFTLLTPLNDYTYGTFAAYLVLGLLMCLNLKQVELGPALVLVWRFTNIGNLILAALLIAQEPTIKNFFVENYSAYYDELVPNMLNSGKPILSFASHSLASFFFFICFYLNLRTYAARGNWFSLVAAVLYLVTCGFLKSVTACFVIPVGIAELIAYTWGRRAVLAFATVLVIAVFSSAVHSKEEWTIALNELTDTLNAEQSGLRGRYSSSGVLAPDIDYILEHPFRPIGIGYSESLWYADSGPTELVLRGSIPLLITVYGGFWLFLKKNLFSRETARVLFFSYFAFEFGFSNLLYSRTLCLVPFVVVYLNHLDQLGSSHPVSEAAGL